jgi:Transcription factor WhiB
VVVLLLDTDTDFPDVADGGVGALAAVFDVVKPPRPTPCQSYSDLDYWFPDRVEEIAQRRRAATFCDTCYFRVNCAVNALESGSEFGIWAGVAVFPSPARLRKARQKIAEVIAAAVIDTGEVPYRVGLMLRRRSDLAQLVADATMRVRSGRQKRRAPRRMARCQNGEQRRSA